MKHIIEGYIAKDGDEQGRVCLFSSKPIRGKGIFHNKQWICPENCSYLDLPRHIFKEIKWEDEPHKVRLTVEDAD